MPTHLVTLNSCAAAALLVADRLHLSASCSHQSVYGHGSLGTCCFCQPQFDLVLIEFGVPSGLLAKTATLPIQTFLLQTTWSPPYLFSRDGIVSSVTRSGGVMGFCHQGSIGASAALGSRWHERSRRLLRLLTVEDLSKWAHSPFLGVESAARPLVQLPEQD
jgi:hypothetical protein